jgi:hypothetical protein
VAREREAGAFSLSLRVRVGWNLNIPGSEQRTAARLSGEWPATRKRGSWLGESEIMVSTSAIWSIAILVAILDNMYNVDRYGHFLIDIFIVQYCTVKKNIVNLLF